MGDTECQKDSCSSCRVPAYETWTIRGICEEEERMNYLDLEASPLGLRGYGEYAIRRLEGIWTWYNSVSGNTIAKFVPEKGQPDYPFGRRIWNLTTDVCTATAGSALEITLSPCGPGHFTCTDGKCIDFGSRCDLKFDCDDKTDESFCDIVNFPPDYKLNLPPRPLSNSPLPISINVSIDTMDINTETMMLSSSYNLRMTWYDNRLSYNNLKQLTRLNTLSKTQVDELWKPLIGFINTDDIQQSAVDEDAITTIIKHTKNFAHNLTNSYEVEIYGGSENPISTTRKYFTIFKCNFDLTLYPFDIQECFIQFKILSASDEYLVFNISESYVEYLGSKYLVEYGIGRVALEEDVTKQYAAARVTVQLVRRYGYAMLNIYIPSMILLIISCLTLFFRPPIFEVRLMTALTSLLVLATLFTQVSASLPKTSYFKMVDIWLLFCIFAIFLIIAFHAVIDNYIDYGSSINSGGHYETMVTAWTNKDEIKTVKEILRTGTDGVMANKLHIWIVASKVVTFFLSAVFNFVYWGLLGVSSGLVYQY
ncbi:glycine receptor subunit alpha-2 [Hyalella azteca]|uniref:Glycine receptor subunit alpha-2 n=1 Tax=Hyalella azteca TaxID=294128 RepID=A0A979FJD0_HYAAZ|nr:glycine receptor subunit alpha-2 [Hyalella azteca]